MPNRQRPEIGPWPSARLKAATSGRGAMLWPVGPRRTAVRFYVSPGLVIFASQPVT